MSSSSPTTESKALLPSDRRPARILFPLSRRRRRTPIIRLGARRGWRAAAAARSIVGFLHFRSLAARWSRCMKRIGACYSQLVKDIIEGATAVEAVQARILMESYLSVPVMAPAPVTPTGNCYSRW